MLRQNKLHFIMKRKIFNPPSFSKGMLVKLAGKHDIHGWQQSASASGAHGSGFENVRMTVNSLYIVIRGRASATFEYSKIPHCCELLCSKTGLLFYIERSHLCEA